MVTPVPERRLVPALNRDHDRQPILYRKRDRLNPPITKINRDIDKINHVE
jgi:hypothetical protein